MIQSKFIKWFSKTKKSSFVTYGLPFIIFVFGSSFVLRQFATVRYEISQHKQQLGVTPELLEKMGFNKDPIKPAKSLEEEYAETMRDNDINDWKNVRGPRPWETDNTEYMEVIEKRYQKNKNKSKLINFDTVKQ